MNQIQNDYIQYKTLYDATMLAFCDAMETHHHLLDANKDDEYNAVALAERELYGVNALKKKLEQAETALLEWGKAEMLAASEDWLHEDIEYTYQNAKTSVVAKYGLIGLILRLK